MLSVLFGLAAVVVGALWLIIWGAWGEFLVVLQGSLPPFMILVGLVAVAAGISSIKDNIAAKKEEEKLEEEKPAEEAAPSQPESKTEAPASEETGEEEKPQE